MNTWSCEVIWLWPLLATALVGIIIYLIWKGEGSTTQNQADARLIVQAPYMLAEIRELADHFYGTERGRRLFAILRDVEGESNG